MDFKLLNFGDAEKVAVRLEQSAERSVAMPGVMEEIVTSMLTAERALFSSQGRRGGGSWAALKPSTVLKKGNGRILYTDGANPGYSHPGNDALVRSLTERGAAYQEIEVGPTSVSFGTSAPGAAIVHEGGAGIRARPLIKFMKSDYDKWNRMITDHLMAGLFDE